MAATISLQTVVDFCSTHADLLPLTGVGGYTNEPALSLCNDTLSELLSDPNDWKFNRVRMPMLVTCPNKIDQLFAGACIFTLNPSSGSGALSQGWGIGLSTSPAISVVSGTVIVQTLEDHRISVGSTVYMIGVTMTTGTTANYNSTFSDNGSVSGWSGGWVVTAVTANSISFAAVSGQNNGDAGGAPGITNFGYATEAYFQEMNNTSSPPNIWPATTYRQLPYTSRIANPNRVAVMDDLGTGVLRIRYGEVPGSTTFGLWLVYQAQAPVKTELSQTWSPFPDNYACVYRQALLYRMYRYLNDPKADNEYKKLQAEISRVQAADSAEATDVNLQPASLMDPSYWSYGGWW